MLNISYTHASVVVVIFIHYMLQNKQSKKRLIIQYDVGSCGNYLHIRTQHVIVRIQNGGGKISVQNKKLAKKSRYYLRVSEFCNTQNNVDG